MNKEEYADKFMSRAKQDIKICENEHELQIYISDLLENIDYWQNEYGYMKKYRDTLQQENKQLKEEIKAYQDMYFDKVIILNKAIEMFESDEHFEDGCYCLEIENMLKGDSE